MLDLMDALSPTTSQDLWRMGPAWPVSPVPPSCLLMGDVSDGGWFGGVADSVAYMRALAQASVSIPQMISDGGATGAPSPKL